VHQDKKADKSHIILCKETIAMLNLMNLDWK